MFDDDEHDSENKQRIKNGLFLVGHMTHLVGPTATSRRAAGVMRRAVWTPRV